MENRLTHFTPTGEAHMVDVSGKDITRRVATAEGSIVMNAAAFAAVQNGDGKKGDVLSVARIAGIMGAKRTADLIPLCHPVATEAVTVDFVLQPAQGRVQARCTVQTTGRTGVEMEALTGASVALLTVYDMCKALDRGMELHSIRLVEKDGGRSGHYHRAAEEGTP